MSQEDHNLGGGGVYKSKLCKQKKVAQRGLGVAQLEKIILEEERKREALTATNVLPNNSITCVSPTHSTPPNLCPNFQQSFPIQVPNERGELEFQEMLAHGNEDRQYGLMWKGEITNLEVENRLRVEGMINRDALVLPRPGSPHLQHLSCSSSLSSSLVVSAYSCGISPLQEFTEPPSNQIIHGNNYSSTPWPGEEDKMVGMKRSYPFSLESPPIPTLAPNLLPIYPPSGMRPNGLPYKYMRDGPLKSSSLPEPKTNVDERLNGDFLTLAPPMAASPPLDSKDEYQSYYLGYQELQSTRENVEREIHWIRPTKEEAFNFFLEVNQNGRGDKGETIDLSLRL